ncbi:MAG TPA: CesT family type III secretion system chaperone [Polyangiaceae bacterium]
MVQTNEDLEAYLTRLERSFERIEDGTYVIKMGAGRPLVAARLAPPVLVLRVAIGSAPSGSAALYRRLLELNATALLHAAYGLEGDRIVLASALELESIDLNELEAVLADIDLALAEHVPSLHELVKSQG